MPGTKPLPGKRGAAGADGAHSLCRYHNVLPFGRDLFEGNSVFVEYVPSAIHIAAVQPPIATSDDAERLTLRPPFFA